MNYANFHQLSMILHRSKLTQPPRRGSNTKFIQYPATFEQSTFPLHHLLVCCSVMCSLALNWQHNPCFPKVEDFCNQLLLFMQTITDMINEQHSDSLKTDLFSAVVQKLLITIFLVLARSSASPHTVRKQETAEAA